jgi:hypothetical protein
VACELAAPGDQRLPRLRARLGLALAWALRMDEAVQWGWQLVHAILGTTDELAMATDEGWEEVLRLVEDASGTRGQFVRWAQSTFVAGRARIHARLGQPDRALELLSAVLPRCSGPPPGDGPTRELSATPPRPCGCWTDATTCP